MPLNTDFKFQSIALKKEKYQVMRFTGEEGISQPYRFEIELVSQNPSLHLTKILSKPATFSIRQGDEIRNIHGIVAEMELSQELPGQRYAYRVVLVPRLWLLSLNQQNQIFQDLSVPAIIQQTLLSAGSQAPTSLSKDNLFSDYLAVRLQDDSSGNGINDRYPRREYIVQYGETDLSFISRLMEHEGISYYFEQGEHREKLIITDNNNHFLQRTDAGDINYQTAGDNTVSSQRTVRQLRSKLQQLPQQVLLKDYNYRNASLPYEGRQSIADNGIGLIAEYGAHFKTPEEGLHYANVRAETYKCQQHTLSAESDNHHFNAGERFTLKGHHLADFNRNYLITEINHSGVTQGQESDQSSHYHNTFRCQPGSNTYRPPKVTPKPRLYGIMNATIDGCDETGRAEIDQQGRYKVIMPFDVSGAAEGQASRYLRLATPFSGSNQGMHFPLQKGTEVIWTCIDGDLDRPIIIGSVPNSINKSVATSENNSTNVIKTASGIRMEFNDGVTGGLSQHVSQSFGHTESNNAANAIDGLGNKYCNTSHGDISNVNKKPNDKKHRNKNYKNEKFYNKNDRCYGLQQQQHFSSTAISIVSQGDVEEGRPLVFTVTLPHSPPAGHCATLKFTASGTSTSIPDLVIDANSSLVQTVSVNTQADINTVGATVTLSLNTITYSSGYPASHHYLAQASATGNVLDKEVSLAGSGGTIFYRVNVPYVPSKNSYLRIGTSPVTANDAADPPTCTPGSDTECTVWSYHREKFLNISDAKMLWLFPTPGDINFAIDWPQCKWLEHTDGTRVAITGGDYNIFSNGSVATTSLGTSITYTLNDSYEVVMSSKYDVTSQFNSSIGIGGAVNAFLGAQVDLNAGVKFDASPQKRVSVLGGSDVSYTRNVETNAVKSVKFQVEDTNITAAAIGAGIAATLGAVTGAVAVELTAKSDDPAQKDKLTRAIRDVSTTVWAAGTAAVATLSVMSLIKKLKPKPQSTFEMYKDQVFLQCGDAALLMKSDGTIILDGKNIIINGTDKVEINSKDASISASETALSAKNFSLSAATKMSGNLNIEKGSLDVPSGTIKGAGGKIGEQVFLAPPAAPVVSDADVQLAQQFGSVNQILQVAMLRRRQALMGDDS